MRVATAKIKDLLTKIPGTQHVKYSTADPKPQIEIQLDREKMANLGINATEVGTAISNASGVMILPNTAIKAMSMILWCSLDDFDKSNMSDVSKLRFTNSQGLSFECAQLQPLQKTWAKVPWNVWTGCRLST